MALPPMMPAGARRKKTAAKVAPKTVIAELVASGRALAADPSPVIPEVEGSWWATRSLRSAVRRMRRVASFSADPARLRRHARRPTLAGALAVALLLPHEEDRIGHLAQYKAGDREVLYVQRGRIPREFLVSTQYHGDPELRLLAWHRLLRRRPLHAWATSAGVVVRPVTAPPPEGFLRDWELQALASCAHRDLPPNEQPWRVTLELRGSDATFMFCSGEPADGAYEPLLRHVAGLRPRLAMVRVEGNPLECRGTCPRCHWLEDAVAPHREHGLGELLAHSAKPGHLADETRAKAVAAVGTTRVPIVVGGESCFGEDRAALLAALQPTDEERPHLKAALGGLATSVQAEEDAPGKLLAALWPQVGEAVLRSAGGGARVAPGSGPPREQISTALEAVRKGRRLSGLPRYAELPPRTRIADEAARAFRTGGATGVLEVAQRHQSSRDASFAPLLLALYECAGQGSSRAWQFSRDDTEAASFLVPALRELLECPDERYDAVLDELRGRLAEN